MRSSVYPLMSALISMPAVAALSLMACAHNPESAPRPGSASPQAEASPAKKDEAALATAASRQCQSDEQCGDGQLCLSNACAAPTAELCSKSRVAFPFNSAQLPEAERPALQRAARCLQANHNLSLTIEGNADERGTAEYNLALGEQRARGIARYLKQLGALDSQLKTVSYGKDKPLCTEHDEDCWAKNRHAALKVREVAND